MKVTIDIPEQHVGRVRNGLVTQLVFAADGVVAAAEKGGESLPLDLLRSTVERVNAVAAAVEQLERNGDTERLTIDANEAELLLNHIHELAMNEIHDGKHSIPGMRSWLDFAEWVEAEQERHAELVEVAA